MELTLTSDERELLIKLLEQHDRGLLKEIRHTAVSCELFGLCSMEVPMPRYEFYCDDCNKPFELILTLAEHEKGTVKCPRCGKEHVHQEAAAFFALTSKKS